jgi:hypothetical protein
LKALRSGAGSRRSVAVKSIQRMPERNAENYLINKDSAKIKANSQSEFSSVQNSDKFQPICGSIRMFWVATG